MLKTTKKNLKLRSCILVSMALCAAIESCNVPRQTVRAENRSTPGAFGTAPTDTTNASGAMAWRSYFTDPYLSALIDTALVGNQEINILAQEILVGQNEARARKGDYLPFVGIGGGAGMGRVSRYTEAGATEHNESNTIATDHAIPALLPDFFVGLRASWEVDVWHKLRNRRQAAILRYLATAEGRNFAITNIVAEIANTYYELRALDNQQEILQQNIAIQQNALSMVRLLKEGARVTELAVRRFEAEVAKTQSMQFDIRQRIAEGENRINYLLGRFPQPVPRTTQALDLLMPPVIQAGIPSQLLANRPDIRQAELEIAASRLDVAAARAEFYPSVNISAAVGFQAFNPAYIVKAPESLLFSLAGDLLAPLVNRNAIKANYATANARQLQAVYDYERTILNAYVEVANQLSNMGNLAQGYELKRQQVDALNRSIAISTDLFKAARADYMEVLLTQRDALEAKFDLVEMRQRQMRAVVDVYRALGGGWR